MSRRASYLQVADFERVEEWCRNIRILFDDATPYMVGSVNQHPDYRDVDIRLLLDDGTFDAAYADPLKHRLMNRAISTWGQRETGLPIDFQLQQQTAANDQFPDGFRNPMGGRDWTQQTPEGRPKRKRAKPPSETKERRRESPCLVSPSGRL